MSRHLALLASLALAAVAPAADTSRGDALLDAFFRHQTKQIADAEFSGIATRADWETRRPELRRQFLDMMGLWPTPPRTDLKPVVTGKVELETIVIEKLHFQSAPGLYVTANLYLPKKAPFPVPGILYVCGHGASVVDGVPHGNKVTYQHHGAWLAEHGYACLTVDTLQLGEIAGLHHGTHNLGMWWWLTLGYTPAGIECWNGVRALDYLQSRKEVDGRRLGVTGRSGGGATSWWVAAADDRVSCIVPVAGLADLHAHVVEGLHPRFQKGGVVSGHCDCMYMVNTYRWDFATVAALCAPRALMLGNSDDDGIFPVLGYRRVAAKVRRIYDLYGAGDKFALLETAGPHKDTTELRLGAFRWLNRHLKGEEGDVAEREWPKLPPPRLKVFDRLPADALNATIHETFLKPAVVELPTSAEVAKAWWPEKKKELMEQLQEKTFRGWTKTPPPLATKPGGDVTHGSVRVRAFDFTSEEGVPLRLWLMTTQAALTRPTALTVHVVNDDLWKEWTRGLAPAFKDLLQATTEPTFDATAFAGLARSLAEERRAVAVVAPRGIGPTRWAEAGTPADNHVRRRYPLIGQTLDGQRVWDVRRALAVLREMPDLRDVPLTLTGEGDMAGVALYAGIYEPSVNRFDFRDLPPTHRQGPTLLNVRRVLDMPQALALLGDRPVTLHLKDESEAKQWQWTLRLQGLLGKATVKIRAPGE